jgi:hypothetical protein
MIFKMFSPKRLAQNGVLYSKGLLLYAKIDRNLGFGRKSPEIVIITLSPGADCMKPFRPEFSDKT